MSYVIALIPTILAAAMSTPAAPMQSLTAEALTQAVEGRLGEQLQAAGSHASVHVTGRVPAVRLPAGDVDIVVGHVAGPWPRARAAVQVEVLVNQHPVRKLTVWVRAKDPQSMSVYAGNYPAHASAGSLQQVAGDVDRVAHAGAIANPGELVNARLRRAVTAGEPVLAGDFEVIPAVLANQPVGIEVEHGSIHLRTSGVALADGRIGDIVEVRAVHGSKVVRSRVVGNQQVLIHD